MKWTYLPFMFALAFLYTKISYNNFQLEGREDSRIINRRPGSLIEQKGISPFYKVSDEDFYKILAKDDFLIFKKVAPYRGTVVGNVNVEGFGYVVDDKKKVNFNINDISKVTEGVLFHDVLTHLVSSKFLDKKISWLDYFEAYKKGLRGENFSFSFYTERGIEDAFLESEKFLSENISIDYPFEFTKLKTRYHHIDIVKKNLIQNEIKKIFPKVQFFDLLESNNDKTLFQVLVRLRPQDKVQWLEVQEMIHTDYDKIFNKNQIIDFKKRFELLKKDLYSGNLDKSLFLFQTNNKFFTIKFAEQFKSSIKLSQIPNDDYHDVIMDEAYAIGIIHAKTLGSKVSNYIKAWATIASQNIDEQVIDLKYRLIENERKKIDR